MNIEWRGQGTDEGASTRSASVRDQVDPRYFRPTEVETLLGDATKARTKLGWRPQIAFDTLVHEMVGADLEAARRDASDGVRVSRPIDTVDNADQTQIMWLGIGVWSVQRIVRRLRRRATAGSGAAPARRAWI